jgi:hypothetical protein
MIAIKDMEMPNDCFECPIYNKESRKCNIIGDLDSGNCPLKEIVTCEKCRHRDMEFLNASGKCKCMKNYNLHDLNDYCKDGERRE